MIPIFAEIIKLLIIQILNYLIETIRRKYHEKKKIKQTKERENVQQKCRQTPRKKLDD